VVAVNPLDGPAPILVGHTHPEKLPLAIDFMPDLNFLVDAGAGYELTAGGKAHAGHVVIVSLHLLDFV
jgi:hypothetical protein